MPADIRFSPSLSSCKPPTIHSPVNVSQFLLCSTALYNLTEEVNCPAFGQSAQVLGNIAIGTATLNILYRAWAISMRYGRFLTISLAIAEVGHWGLLIWNLFTVHSEWSQEAGKCNVTVTSRPALVTLYVYSTSPFHCPGPQLTLNPVFVAMLFDFTILVICMTGLWRHKPKAGAGRSIWQLLRRQGPLSVCASPATPLTNLGRDLLLLYIVHCQLLSFPLHRSRSESCARSHAAHSACANLPAAVMNAITTVPAACATTIASCRAVIWLTTWVETDGSGYVPPVEDHRKSSSPVLLDYQKTLKFK